MININLAGTSFVKDEVFKEVKQIKKTVWCAVKKIKLKDGDENLEYDAHYGIWANGKKELHLGYIPQMKTVQRYMGEAFKKQDRFKHDWQYDRSKAIRKIRDNVTVDIVRNNLPVYCKLESLYQMKEQGIWSVVVSFDYDV
jgi:hypothetical protein|tara:strand:+ start:348 stop:770 length:423 start_codon:yes stop_codon:yes gene_type:complete